MHQNANAANYNTIAKIPIKAAATLKIYGVAACTAPLQTFDVSIEAPSVTGIWYLQERESKDVKASRY